MIIFRVLHFAIDIAEMTGLRAKIQTVGLENRPQPRGLWQHASVNETTYENKLCARYKKQKQAISDENTVHDERRTTPYK